MLLRTPWKRIIFFICVCGWYKLDWKETKHWFRCGKYSIKVDLEDSTSFLDHVHLVCTQRQCEISKDIDNYSTMFESRISAGATEKLPCSENLSNSSWSYDVEGHVKKCVERCCGLTNRTIQQLTKCQLYALTTIISKKKNWNPWENRQKHAHKLFWNTYTWH